MSLYYRKQKLIKENQELYSWYWFYLNSENNLQYSRYPKSAKDIMDRDTKEIKKVTIIPYLDYSKRFKEDREKAFQVNLKIRENQRILDSMK